MPRNAARGRERQPPVVRALPAAPTRFSRATRFETTDTGVLWPELVCAGATKQSRGGSADVAPTQTPADEERQKTGQTRLNGWTRSPGLPVIAIADKPTVTVTATVTATADSLGPDAQALAQRPRLGRRCGLATPQLRRRRLAGRAGERAGAAPGPVAGDRGAAGPLGVPRGDVQARQEGARHEDGHPRRDRQGLQGGGARARDPAGAVALRGAVRLQDGRSAGALEQGVPAAGIGRAAPAGVRVGHDRARARAGPRRSSGRPPLGRGGIDRACKGRDQERGVLGADEGAGPAGERPRPPQAGQREGGVREPTPPPRRLAPRAP